MNEISADVLDIIFVTDQKKTNEEVEFITSQIAHGSPIMDLGCGTGRHTVPLATRGYDVIAVDGSKEMLMKLLENLQKNDVQALVLHSDIMKIKSFDQKCGGVICFGNSFCEMATNKEQADHILKLIYDSLIGEGKVIVEITNNPDSLNPEDFEMEKTVEKDSKTYKFSQKVEDFDRVNNVTITNAQVEILEGESTQTLGGSYTSRWWRKAELDQMFKEAGFSNIELFGEDFLPFKDTSKGLILVATK